MKSLINKYSLDAYMVIITGYVISIIAAISFDYLHWSGSIPFYTFCIIVILHLLVWFVALIAVLFRMIEQRRTFIWTAIFLVFTILLAVVVWMKLLPMLNSTE